MEAEMHEPTHGDYNINQVNGIDTLRNRMTEADSPEAWSHILADYISWGNNKIAKSVAIFNMNSATDCPNADTDNCQVPWNDCYAHQAEYIYDTVLAYRRRQEYLWDCLDADTWAKAFLEIVSRKRNDVTAIRFSEAGDFRHRGDIIKVDRIAEILSDHNITVYTYSASNYLDWSLADHFVVNQSNDLEPYGDRLFSAVPTESDIPEDGVMCPFEKAKNQGVDTEDRPKCGECRLCLNKEGPDVYITLH